MPDYHHGNLFVESVSLHAVAAAVGTPCYVYSKAALQARWRAYDRAFGARSHRICYAVKANDNLSIIRVLQQLGSGFDIVSGGELERALAAGAAAQDIVFSGVGKSRTEIARAIDCGIACINVESAAELARVAALAAARRRVVAVAVRVNPDVDAATHPYISTGLKETKFGVPLADAPALYRAIAADPWLEAAGIACHIGSQLTTVAPVVEAVGEIVGLAEILRGNGIALTHLDVGGGLGIRYRAETPPPIETLVAAVCAAVPAHYTVMMEPGRSLVGAAGTLLTTVEYLKQTPAKNFAIVDAGMNDLLRPALYDAWHDVLPVQAVTAGDTIIRCDVVGPICETGDWLARDRELPAAAGRLLAILDAGAYGFAMTSNYNARPRPPEVLIDNDRFSVIRARETLTDLMANELAHLSP